MHALIRQTDGHDVLIWLKLGDDLVVREPRQMQATKTVSDIFWAPLDALNACSIAFLQPKIGFREQSKAQRATTENATLASGNLSSTRSDSQV